MASHGTEAMSRTVPGADDAHEAVPERSREPKLRWNGWDPVNLEKWSCMGLETKLRFGSVHHI